MATTAPTTDPSAATTLDNSDASATTDLYRAAVGPVSTDYYQRNFNRFEAADRVGISWNWGAALLTFNWMAFRQLWGAALAYTGALVAAALLVFGIGGLVFQFSQELQWGLAAALAALSVVLPGVFGNALLHAACRKRMARALSANTTVPEACNMLRREAPTRKRAAVLAVVNIALLGAATALYLGLPNAGELPLKTGKMDEARNQVLGKVTDLATRAATPAAPAASAASAPATAPAPAASAALATVPVSPASAPALTTPVAAASAPVRAASAPATAASAPAPTVAVSATSPAASAPAIKPVTATPSATPAAKPASQPASPAVTAPPAKPKAETQPANNKPAASPTQAKSPPQDKKFYVNVGLFADENNARNAHTKLVDAELPALKQEVRGPKGKFTRVRVGPFETMAEADTAAEKIRTLGLDAIVLAP